jgi:ribosomal protein S18 acetylase RimI-like enzyme
MAGSTASALVSLREATDDDRAFLVALYGSTRADLALVPLDDEQRDALVRMQFHAQDVHYRQTSPHADFAVVEIDGRAAGRLYVDRTAGDIRIIDIALMPEHRGSGIGRALILGLLDEAASTGRTASLHVAMGNAAEALYARLGFQLVADDGVYRLMEWRAP